MSFATMMVHLDVERDCEQRIQFALDLADRFQAEADRSRRPGAAAGFRGRGLVVYSEPTGVTCSR